MAARRFEKIKIEVKGESFEAAVKLALDTGGVLLNLSAEFEDCKRIAKKCGLPVKEVLRRVEEAGWSRFS